MDTQTVVSPDGDISVQSSDTDGNNYRVDTWTDSTGVHTRDSDGNSCTILNDGTSIGC
jgi:hypothetical protein